MKNMIHSGSGIIDLKVYSNTYTALKCLIDNSYYSQIYNNMEKSFWKLTGLSKYKELCTIKMATSRQSGHTTAMCKTAIEYFDSCIFLSPTLDMSLIVKSHIMDRLSDFDSGYSRGISKIETESGKRYMFDSFLNKNSMDKFKEINTEAVFVDCAFKLTPKKEEEIYKTLGPCMDKNNVQFFIMIQ